MTLSPMSSSVTLRTWISSAAVFLARSRAYHISKAQYKCVANLVNLDLNLAIHRQFSVNSY